MNEPWIAERLAPELLEEEAHSLLSRTSLEDGARSSNASTMVPLTVVEHVKRGYVKQPILSLMAMTCGVGGLQILWSTIFSHGSSYLFSLGISTTQSSLIWAAAPICGSTVQPIVGIISDQARNPWGRRRPFILAGMLATVIASITLAWAEPIATAFCKLLKMANADDTQASFTRGLAIISVVLLNIAIQPLQLGLRSLSIDACPQEQQATASAWASRFAGVGNVIGYVLGALPLPWISSNYEAVRFRYMVHATTLALVTTTFITCYFTEEDDPRSTTLKPLEERRAFGVFRYVLEGFSDTTQRIRRVYLVQFFSWMGWFGFLFYSTTFISQLYVEEQARRHIATSSSQKDHGMRIGSIANLLFSIFALSTNIVLPRLSKAMTSRSRYDGEKTRPQSSRLHKIWGFGQLVYVISLLSSVVVSSSAAGTLVVAIAGLSWGVTQWVPYSILGEEAARQCSHKNELQDDGTWAIVQGGKIMGMHNAAISVPQIIAALMSSAIFGVARRLGTENAIAWVLGWSVIPASTAAWLAFNI